MRSKNKRMKENLQRFKSQLAVATPKAPSPVPVKLFKVSLSDRVTLFVIAASLGNVNLDSVMWDSANDDYGNNWIELVGKRVNELKSAELKKIVLELTVDVEYLDNGRRVTPFSRPKSHDLAKKLENFKTIDVYTFLTDNKLMLDTMFETVESFTIPYPENEFSAAALKDGTLEIITIQKTDYEQFIAETSVKTTAMQALVPKYSKWNEKLTELVRNVVNAAGTDLQYLLLSTPLQ